MDPKSDAKAATDALGVKVSPEQVRLVQNKIEVLRKARDLQTQLAGVRSEVTRIDQEMLKAGFHIPALACW